MGKKNLGTAHTVTTMANKNTILIEVGGSIRRITLENLINAINEGENELLHSVAWGIPLKQNQSSPAWGRIGNLQLWEEYKSRAGRYLVTNTGKAAKLAVNNSGVYADGTTLDETKGHVMTVFDDLYYLVKTDYTTGITYLWMSFIPIGGHCIKRPVIGAYKGSMSGSALTSRSNHTIAGTKTITEFWNAAQVNGKSWGLTNYEHRKFMMMLALSEYGNPNIQACLGNGVTGTNNNWVDWETPINTLKTGATKSLGDIFGTVPCNYTMNNGTAVTDATRVSVMGIEDPYGWQWEMIQGVYCGKSENSGQTGAEVFIYEGNRMPTNVELSTHPEGQYRQIERISSEGYISKETLGEYFDLFPTEVGGGSTSNWTDYTYANIASGQLVLWGGSAYDGAYCGLAYATSGNAFSLSNPLVGARLAYYGELEFCNGAEI